MPRANIIQTSFDSGVQDPLLAGRADLEHYYKGLKTGTDILPRLQGGFSRRPGTAYHDTVTTDGRLQPFVFNSSQVYCIYFGELELKVFLNGVLQATVVTPWTAAESHELGIAQEGDVMIICHEDHEPRKLVRITNTIWNFNTYTFVNTPLYDFNDTDSPTPSDETHTITFSASGWADGDTFKLAMGEVGKTDEIIWTSDTDLLEERIVTAINARINDNTIEENSSGVFRRLATTRVAQGQTLEGLSVDASAYPVVDIVFADADVGAYKELTPIQVNTAGAGSLAFTSYTAGTTRREVVISGTRGWPKYPYFYQGRLWLAGLKSLPQAALATQTNYFRNLGLGDSYDDQGIFILLDTFEPITGIVGGRNLILLTSGGEHIITDSPITPGTVSAPMQSDYGSLPIQPLSLEGAAIFAHIRGKQIMESVFYWQEDAYRTRSISLLSQHLIKTPRQMAVQKGTTLDSANYVFTVNTDGTMAVMLSSRAQELAAWAEWTTDGKYKSVCVAADEVYVLVERTINGSTVYYLERFATNVYTDAASLQTLSPATDVVTGLSHLEGKDVKVRADGGILYPDETVASGQITMEQTASSVEVGLNYEPTAETMPPAPNFGESTLAATKRITWVKAVVDGTRGLRINGDIIPDRQTDVDVLDTPPPERTGVVEHRPKNSRWELSPTVTFSQSDPHPMTVLAAVLEVEVNER